jgi:20S proteasome subunit beta 7
MMCVILVVVVVVVVSVVVVVVKVVVVVLKVVVVVAVIAVVVVVLAVVVVSGFLIRAVRLLQLVVVLACAAGLPPPFPLPTRVWTPLSI